MATTIPVMKPTSVFLLFLTFGLGVESVEVVVGVVDSLLVEVGAGSGRGVGSVVDGSKAHQLLMGTSVTWLHAGGSEGTL